MSASSFNFDRLVEDIKAALGEKIGERQARFWETAMRRYFEPSKGKTTFDADSTGKEWPCMQSRLEQMLEAVQTTSKDILVRIISSLASNKFLTTTNGHHRSKPSKGKMVIQRFLMIGHQSVLVNMSRRTAKISDLVTLDISLTYRASAATDATFLPYYYTPDPQQYPYRSHIIGVLQRVSSSQEVVVDAL